MNTRKSRRGASAPVVLVAAMAWAVVLSLLLAPASVVLAAEAGETPAPSGPGTFRVAEGGPMSSASGPTPEGMVAVTADDGGAWEYGIEGAAADLWQAVNAEAYGLHVWLNPWMNKRYYWTNNNAWEEDYKRHDLGGNNNNYVDAVDLAFYVGHGSPSSFTFSNAAHDDDRITPNDCQYAWGDNDNEWVALTSCQVLADSNLSAWRNCQNGQHLTLGFVTNASAYNSHTSTQAYHFGRYLSWGFNVPQAWYAACDVAQRGRITRTIINELSHLNDNPALGRSGPDSLDGDWWYQTHYCGTETAIATPQDITALPVLKVIPLGPEEAAGQFGRLGQIFSVPISTTLAAGASADDPFFTSVITDSAALEMDKTAGLYKYTNLAQLWTEQQAEQALAARAANPDAVSELDPAYVRRIAESFLKESGLLLPDAVFNQAVADTLTTTEGGSPGDPAAAGAAVTTTVDIVWQAEFARHIQLPAVRGAQGLPVQTEFSVVGPGAKLKVYMAPLPPGTAAGTDGGNPILGVQGGWRQVETPVNAASGEAAMVEIGDVELLKALYLLLEDEISLNDIPLDTVSREVISHTLAYWEQPPGVAQDELIPVYEFLVSMVERTTGETVEDYAYVPANTVYMPPLARIVDGVPSEAVPAGTAVTLVAADASKSLKDLGLGEFDFPMGSGDPLAYQYEWFQGSVDPANLIGTGMTLADYGLPGGVDEKAGGIPIILRVTDTGNPNQLSATDVAQILVQPATYLPLIQDEP